MTKNWANALAMLAIGLVASTHVRAEPPVSRGAAEPKPTKVRQLGSALGSNVTAKEAEAPTKKSVSPPAKGAQQGAGNKQPLDQPAAPPTASASAVRAKVFRAMAPRVTRPEEIPPAVRLELRRHALCTAKLNRITALARALKDQGSLDRAQQLLGRERSRHQKLMDRFWPPPPRAAPTTPREDEPEEDPEASDPDNEARDKQEGAEP